MSPLGPWPGRGSPHPVAVAVSGGADSTALAVLSQRWSAARGFRLLALVVDHGLRPESASQARDTVAGLGARGIEARLLTVRGLAAGSGLARRARIVRYRLLTEACREAGALDLLLGHHAGDQAETVLMRARAVSGPDGLAGMAALVETSDLRLLRPLLRIPPDRLRRTLTQHAISWIEDPSNSDQRAQRARIRNELSGSTDGLAARLLSVAALSGADRMARRRAEAEVLAARAVLRPEGFAYLPPELLPAGPMAALLQTMGGGRYRPSPSSVDRLIRRPIPATLAGIRVMPAGRIGPGWLLVREAAAIGNPVQATDGTIWDGRFRLDASGHPPPLPRDACVDALGGDQAAMRPLTTLPSAVLSSLPVLRHQGRLCAVPHLRWAAGPVWAGFRFAFASAVPASDQALFTPT